MMDRYAFVTRLKRYPNEEWVALRIFVYEGDTFCGAVLKAVEAYEKHHHTSEGYATIACDIVAVGPTDHSVLLSVKPIY